MLLRVIQFLCRLSELFLRAAKQRRETCKIRANCAKQIHNLLCPLLNRQRLKSKLQAGNQRRKRCRAGNHHMAFLLDTFRQSRNAQHFGIKPLALQKKHGIIRRIRGRDQFFGHPPGVHTDGRFQ